MKKLLIVLLSLMALQMQGQIIQDYPTYTDGYAKIAGQEVAIRVALPDSYKADQVYPYMLFVHGMGQRGPGTKSALNTVYTGANQAIPDDWKMAVNKYGIIGVLVNYNEFFQPAQWLWANNFVKSKYKVVDKPMAQGFSWGGGSLQKLYCSSLAYAGLPAAAIVIAPTIELNSGWDNVGKANLPVWIMVNKGDNVTGAAAARNSANYINSFNPEIPATYTEYDENGHGGTNRGLALIPPAGFAENVYEWYLDVLKNGPRAPKKGTTTTPPPIVQPPTTTLTAVAKEIGVTSTADIKLDGTASTGWQGATWGTISVPAGVNIYSKIVTGGAGWITGTATLPKEGAYTFVLNVYSGSQSAKDTIVVTYQKTTVPIPVVPVSFDSETGYLVLSDGTRIKAIATVYFSTKKVTVKDQAGIVYTW